MIVYLLWSLLTNGRAFYFLRSCSKKVIVETECSHCVGGAIIAWHRETETEMAEFHTGKNDQAVCVYVFITLCTLARERPFLSSLLCVSTQVAPPLSPIGGSH